LTITAVDVYDFEAARWSTLDAPLPTPRAGAGAVALGGRLLVMGGESARQVPAHAEVEAYDPRSGRCSAPPPLPRGRHGTQATVLDEAVHVAAGSGGRGGGARPDDHPRLPRWPRAGCRCAVQRGGVGKGGYKGARPHHVPGRTRPDGAVAKQHPVAARAIAAGPSRTKGSFHVLDARLRVP